MKSRLLNLIQRVNIVSMCLCLVPLSVSRNLFLLVSIEPVPMDLDDYFSQNLKIRYVEESHISASLVTLIVRTL